MEKIFNLGFSKTGTTTFEALMTKLDYAVCRGHWKHNYCFYLFSLCINKDWEEIHRMTKYWDAFSDGPWGGGTELYKYLLKWYPNARFVLTIRSEEEWYKSFEKLVTIFHKDQNVSLSYYHKYRWGSAYWFRNIFDIKELTGNKEKIIKKYKQYNNEVIDYFNRKEKELLVWDLSLNADWDVICDYLDIEPPDISFPHSNKTPDDLEKKRRKMIADTNKRFF